MSAAYPFRRAVHRLSRRLLPQERLRQARSRELFRKKYSISPKEQAIIDLLASGMTYAQAAEHLFISINTVRSHVKSIYSKAGVKNLRSLLSLYKTIEP